MAWWTRQRSSRGPAPPRTAMPVCPAATTSQSSNSPPAPSSTLMPTPGRIVDRAAAHRRAGGAAHLYADRGPGDDPQVRQLGGAVLDEQRGGARCPGPRHAGPGRPRRRVTVSGTPSAGRSAPMPGPSAPRRVTARVDHQVLPVGARGDRRARRRRPPPPGPRRGSRTRRCGGATANCRCASPGPRPVPWCCSAPTSCVADRGTTLACARGPAARRRSETGTQGSRGGTVVGISRSAVPRNASVL